MKYNNPPKPYKFVAMMSIAHIFLPPFSWVNTSYYFMVED